MDGDGQRVAALGGEGDAAPVGGGQFGEARELVEPGDVKRIGKARFTGNPAVRHRTRPYAIVSAVRVVDGVIMAETSQCWRQ